MSWLNKHRGFERCIGAGHGPTGSVAEDQTFRVCPAQRLNGLALQLGEDDDGVTRRGGRGPPPDASHRRAERARASTQRQSLTRSKYSLTCWGAARTTHAPTPPPVLPLCPRRGRSDRGGHDRARLARGGAGTPRRAGRHRRRGARRRRAGERARGPGGVRGVRAGDRAGGRRGGHRGAGRRAGDARRLGRVAGPRRRGGCRGGGGAAVGRARAELERARAGASRAATERARADTLIGGGRHPHVGARGRDRARRERAGRGQGDEVGAPAGGVEPNGRGPHERDPCRPGGRRPAHEPARGAGRGPRRGGGAAGDAGHPGLHHRRHGRDARARVGG
jgi:hypothetical protein